MRRKRLKWLIELMEDFEEPVTILDVGGTEGFWLNHRHLLQRTHQITVLNRFDHSSSSDGIAFVAGDACSMPQFSNQQFNICFSNSVIEHLVTLSNQQRMAAEMRRVACAYFMQTPCRWFPIEPHFLFPFWQFLPTNLRIFLLTKSRIGWLDRQPNREAARKLVEEIRLLSSGEVRSLFPNASVHRERLCGFTKSYIAVGRCPVEIANRNLRGS
jgi:Methyltransferase domain